MSLDCVNDDFANYAHVFATVTNFFISIFLPYFNDGNYKFYQFKMLQKNVCGLNAYTYLNVFYNIVLNFIAYMLIDNGFGATTASW